MKTLNYERQICIVEEEVNSIELIKDVIKVNQPDDPFYICNIDDIINKYNAWKDKLPRVKPHYAVKCNDSEIVIKVLAALGASFDCASKGEINKVLATGVTSDRIIFANPTKPKSHIVHAFNTNCKTMTFDSDYELQKISLYCPGAKLVLRIRCDAKASQCPLGNKFGCNVVTEAPQLIKKASEMGMDIVGISFHVGSGCNEPPVFRRAIKAARELFDLAATYGFNCNLLDIGGGYPGDKGKSIDTIAEIVNKALDDFFPGDDVTVISEPGRYFVASAYTLACNVHSKRSIVNNSAEHMMYFINDGVYGSFNCQLYDHQIVVANPLDLHKKAPGRIMKSSIWGPTCDALDRIIEEVEMEELDIGDWVTFDNMGAYTIPVASPFNGFPLPTVMCFIKSTSW